MSAVLEVAPETLFDAVAPRREPTLAAVIGRTWEGIRAGRTVACPVCSAPMTPVYAAQASPVGGRCGGCGSRLA